jgi:predicted ribosome quality control (RQC) complex YloA/Tae2 family protein
MLWFSLQIYDEFCPLLLNQFRMREHVKFDAFDAALDEFYSKIESQKSEHQQKTKEGSAIQKLNKIRLDQVCVNYPVCIIKEKDGLLHLFMDASYGFC